MKRKYMDKLVGNYCKVVTKEPGEERASVVTGVLENIDYKDGFILIESNQGLGCLRIDNVIAIKPGDKRKTVKRKIKNDSEAMVGIGTLIIFIAMVLVAAVAASVLITTSETLQQRAQSVGTQTIREVSAGIAITDITGYTNENKTKINFLALTIRPRAGSKDIDLSLCTLTTLYDSLRVLELNTSLVAPVNLDNKSVFNTPISKGNNYTILSNSTNTSFGIISLHDPDNSIINTNGINSGDRVMIIINLSAVLKNNASGTWWNESGLPPRQTMTGSMQPEIGSRAVFDITAPAVFSRRIIDLY